ncbi:MAG: hypothetical protein M3N54_00855, partial [Acidobacteriota bacterium]|nr:hypothetical protein [Acidobacteriota bacterium]
MLNRNHKVIAVIGVTREQVELGVAHARTAAESLPVWAWCAEGGDPVAGCDRFTSGANARRVLKDLRGVWPALSIVAWTGEKRPCALKLIPLFIPPFRVVAFNEASGFFAVRPRSLLTHAGRRLRDTCLAGMRRMMDWTAGLGQWFRSVLFALLAVAAKPTAYLARQAMRRAAPGVPSHQAMEPARGSEYIEIPLTDRGWPRGLVAKALADSTADFVVFRARGEQRAAEPLVALARETNAFAAAMQIAWSGWRRVVLHRHPFRALQPGEVAQVEAPHSSLIVMRRDLLLRFGVPRALTSGAAFMQLYWQAAAGGFRSLVVGSGEPLTQEPAMQLEDAEFVLRRVRHVAPAHPERSRG